MQLSCFLILGNDKDDLILARTIYNLKNDLLNAGVSILAKDIGRNEKEVYHIMEQNGISDLPAIIVVDDEEGGEPIVYEDLNDISRFLKSVMNQHAEKNDPGNVALSMNDNDVYDYMYSEIAQNPLEKVSDEKESSEKTLSSAAKEQMKLREERAEMNKMGGNKFYTPPPKEGMQTAPLAQQQPQRAPMGNPARNSMQASTPLNDNFDNINMDEYIGENHEHFANAKPQPSALSR